MTQTVGNAVAQRDEQQRMTPYTIVTKEMAPELRAMLPEHIPSEAWLRIAAGALKRSKVEANGKTELENAAANNPSAFVAALRQAASLGLQPGSDEYFFTTVRNWRNQNKTEILGIVGYQGYVELMYRAGAVESVVVEVVYSTDKFEYVRGVHARPIHDTDWDSDERGELRLAYAYANMKGGAVSKVVVLNKHDIALIRAKSASWVYDQKNNKETSPWTTAPASMWLKSAARQLRKWVPTSASYITERIRAVKAAEQPAPTMPDVAGQHPVPPSQQVHIADPDDLIDGSVDHPIPDPPAEPGEEASAAEPVVMVTPKQREEIGRLFKEQGMTTTQDRLAYLMDVTGREDVRRVQDLTEEEAGKVIAELSKPAAPAQAQ